MVDTPVAEAVHDFFGGAGIPIAGGSDLDCAGACQHELNDVFRGGDATHAEDGNLDGFGGVVNHAQSDGLDGGAGESGGDVGDAGLAGFGVDGHGYESVDQRDGVGAGFLGHVSHLRDAGDVRRELHDQRAFGSAAGKGDDFVERAGITAELDSSVGGVGTGNVQFVGGDAFAFIEDLDGALVIFAGIAEDVGENDDVRNIAELGQFFIDESASANVLQADGVEHAGGGLIQAGRGIASHGFFGQSLNHEAAELAEMDDVLELDAVAESSAGGDDGILELDAAEIHTQVRSACASGGRRHWELVYREGGALRKEFNHRGHRGHRECGRGSAFF